MRYLIALLTALLLIFSPAAAQSDDDSPRLRIAPPDEVLDVLIDLATTYNLNPMKGDDLHLNSVVSIGLSSFLDDPNIDLDTLMRVFLTFREIGWLIWDADLWGQRIIRDWLAKYQPDFAAQSTYIFGDFTIEATPMDFNADGTPEWALNVTTESGQYRQILVAAGEIGALSLIETPLQWFANGYTYYMPQSGFMETQLFQDLTDDGKPEWVLAEGGTGANHQSGGNIRVLQWRGNRLVEISDIFYLAPAGGGAPLFPSGVDVEYDDLDGDGTIEIIVHQAKEDGCNSEWTTVYTWIRTVARFIQREKPTLTLNDTLICALQPANIAWWEGRYPDAIRDYQRFLDAAINTSNYGSTNAMVLNARVKLALSYALLGQTDQASDELDTALRDLGASADENDIIIKLVRDAHAAYHPSQSALQLCAAMYTIFNDYYRYETFADTSWGIVDESATLSHLPFPDAAQAGCDVQAMLVTADPESPETHAALEILRLSDERYAYSRLLQRVRSEAWQLFDPYISYEDSLEESNSLPPALTKECVTYLPLKQRLDITRADLAQFADDPTYGAVVRYQYAWALDDAGFFPDSEVAAAYQFVIDFDPDSPWAKLAALHIE